VDLAEFKRIYQLRAPNLMWFLGAGASAASNVPTAFDMIWDFKRSIFSSERKIPIKHLADLSDTKTRQRIQSHFNGAAGVPSEHSPEEYSYYFERAYSAEADRRAYIEGKLSGASPCYGHLVLAALVKLGKTKAIWTTNFDRLPEDAIIKSLGSVSSLVVSTLNSPEAALQSLNDSRFPLIVKPHGDFYAGVIRGEGWNPGDMVFIDDLKENVEAAKKAGFAGLLFASAIDLERHLQGLGIL